MAEKIRVELDNATDVGFNEIVDGAIKTQKALGEVANKAHEASLGFNAISESTGHVSEASRKAVAEYAALSSQTEKLSSSHGKLKGILDSVTSGISDMAHEWGVSRDTTSSVINGMVGMFGKLAPPIVAATVVIGGLRKIWAETGKEIGEDGKIESNLDRIDAAVGRLSASFSLLGVSEKKAGDDGKGFGAAATEAGKYAISAFDFISQAIRGTSDETVKASKKLDEFLEKTESSLKLKEKLDKGNFASTKTPDETAIDNFKEWMKYDDARKAVKATRDAEEVKENEAKLEKEKEAKKQIDDAIAGYEISRSRDAQDEILRNVKQSLEMQGEQHDALHALRMKQIRIETKRAAEAAKTDVEIIKAAGDGARKEMAAEADYHRDQMKRQADDRKKKADAELDIERKKKEAINALNEQAGTGKKLVDSVNPKATQKALQDAARKKAQGEFERKNLDKFSRADAAGKRQLRNKSRGIGDKAANKAGNQFRQGKSDPKDVANAQKDAAKGMIDGAVANNRLGEAAASGMRQALDTIGESTNLSIENTQKIQQIEAQLQSIQGKAKSARTNNRAKIGGLN